VNPVLVALLVWALSSLSTLQPAVRLLCSPPKMRRVWRLMPPDAQAPSRRQSSSQEPAWPDQDPSTTR
jgi:hypothetical protein